MRHILRAKFLRVHLVEALDDVPDFAASDARFVLAADSPNDELEAQRHRAGVQQETNDATEAYAAWTKREHARYRDDWLP